MTTPHGNIISYNENVFEARIFEIIRHPQNNAVIIGYNSIWLGLFFKKLTLPLIFKNYFANNLIILYQFLYSFLSFNHFRVGIVKFKEFFIVFQSAFIFLSVFLDNSNLIICVVIVWIDSKCK